MVLKIFTRDDTPEVREALDFGKKIQDEGYEVEYYNSDDATATQQMELYDIYSYPSFVVAKDDGTEIECWRGQKPLESDIRIFLTQ